MTMPTQDFKETLFRLVANKTLTSAQAHSLVAALGGRSAPASQRVSPQCTPIAVIGVSGRFPGAADAGELWINLSEGRCAVGPAPLERWPSVDFGSREHYGGFLSGIDEFDPLFFNISPKEAQLMDPQQRIFLEEAWAAIEDAGYSGSRLDGSRCGVFVGVGSGDYSHKLAEQGIMADGLAFMGNASSILTARIAYLLNLKGPCIAIDTACSSSLVAIHLACESLRSGACEVALAGGVCILSTPNFLLAGAASGMLAQGGQCRSFDAAADGFVPAEAAGALLLKPLADAIKDDDFIYGIIEGSAINQDGRTNGITAPSAPAQSTLEREVYRLAKIQPESIAYIEAHGTGTPLGDPIEVEALTQAFPRSEPPHQFCALGSVKTNIGHAMSAAGVVSVIKVLSALKHRQIPPSLHFTRENPALDLASTPFFVPTALQEWPTPQPGEPRRAAVSAFGFSGTNAHMVIAEAPARQSRTTLHRPVDIVLSAKTQKALRLRCKQLLEWLREDPDFEDIAAIAATLALGRAHHEYRMAFTSASTAELQRQLAQEVCDHPSEMAVRYVRGEALDWNELVPLADRRQIPLPTYPFERQPCNPPRRTKPKSLPGLHPLLDRANPSQAGLSFSTCLNGYDPFLRDHVVNGQSILPGACQIEMALAAAATIRENPFPVVMQRISFLRPAALLGRDLEVRTELTREGDLLRFRHAPASAPARGFTEGSIVAAAGTSVTSSFDLPALKRRLGPEEHLEPIFSLFSQAGVVCGPYCRGLQRLWVSGTEALAELQLPEDEAESSLLYTLHPTLLDGAFQAAFVLQSRQGSGAPALVVPFSIERLEVLAPLPQTCFAYLQLTRKAHADPSIEFSLLTPEGALLARVTDFVARTLPSARRETQAEPAMAYFAPTWQELLSPALAASIDPGPILAVETSIDTTEKNVLLSSLRTGPVLLVSLAEETCSSAPGHFSLDWRKYADFVLLLAATKRFSRLYFFARQSSEVDLFDPDSIIGIVDEITISFWHLLKALSEMNIYTVHSPLLIRVLTKKMFAVTNSDLILPAVSTLAGLCRTAAREYPHFHIHLIDSDEDNEGASLQHFDYPSGSTLALRRTRVFRQTLGQIALPCAERTRQTDIRNGGTYIIVGGAGGLGRAFANWLTSQYAAEVVLIGRSVGSAESSHSHLRQGHVEYRQGDVSNLEQIRIIFADIRTQRHHIDGIIHAALVLRDASLNRMDEETLRTVLLPKVAGSLVLGTLLRETNPDFIAFFSSANSHFGNAGQANYAAASTFQDALGLALKQHGLPVKVINWGFWGEVGVVATPFYRERVKRLGVGSIDTTEGINAFAAILRSSPDQVMPMKVSPETLIEMGLAVKPAVTKEVDELGIAFKQVEDYGRHLLRLRLKQSAKLPILPKYDRLKQALDDMFERSGLDGDHDERLVSRLKELSSARGRIVLQYPWIGPFYNLLDACVERYPDVLSGAVPAAQVLFPRSSLELVEPLYRGNPIVDRFNRTVAEAVCNHVESFAKDGRRARILEVGAGTGGTSAGVLAALEPFKDLLSYFYTDISPAFMLHAERTFKPRYPFLHASILDIEQDPAKQHFDPNSFDLILATNVIHATRNINQSVKHLRLLLKEGGVLLLNEAVRVQDFSTITFGLTDGWWLFEDAHLRLPGSPLLSYESWLQVLEANHFEWNPADMEPDSDAQRVFSATACRISNQKLHEKTDPLIATPAPHVDTPSSIHQSDNLDGVTEILRKEIGKALRLAPGEIGLRKRFAEYGVDSILSLDVLRRLGEVFRVGLRATLLFEYPCVADLALHLLTEYPDSVRVLCLPTKPPATIVAADPQVPDQSGSPTLPGHSPGAPIAVVGMAGRFPGAANIREFWSNLRDGICSIGEVPASRWNVQDQDDSSRARHKSPGRWGGFIDDIDRFDPLFFSMSGAESQYTDPQQRLFLQEAWNAFEDAGYSPSFLDGRACGLFVGAGAGDYIHQMYEEKIEPNPYAFLGNGNSVLAARISYLLNLKGPAIAIDTACSSSLVAVHLACQSIASGECEMALAGGVFLSVTPGFQSLTGRLGMLSATGQVHAFDDAADGFVPGEGVGAVVLRPLADALRDRDHIYGVIRATGTNQDGHTNGITSPSAKSQASLQSNLYRKAGIDPATISMVEAHGTGTPLGDPIEMEALRLSFSSVHDQPASIAVGSVKTNIGHAGPAAGIAGLLKTLLSLHYGRIPASLHYTTPNRHINFSSSPFFVNTELRQWEASPNHPRRAVVSAFGLSGTNAHILAEEAPPSGASVPTNDLHVIPLSAQTAVQLRSRMHELLRWLETTEGTSATLADIAYTLATGRLHLSMRDAIEAKSGVELASQLRSRLEDFEVAPQPTSELTRLYMQGSDIDWAALWTERKAYRLSMPTYPFSQDRFWLPTGAKSSPAGPQSTVMLFKPVWRPSPTIDASHEPSAILLLGGSDSLAHALTSTLPLRSVQHAKEFPAHASHLVGLIEPFTTVVYACCDDDLDSLFRLASALQSLSSTSSRQVFILEPEASGVAGAFARSLGRLRRDVRWSTIHTPDPLADAKIIGTLLQARSTCEEWLVSGSALLERRYAAVSMPRRASVFRQRGVYWINGGTGALGHLLAGYLVERYDACVAISGRRSISAPLDGVLYLQADTTDHAAMVHARNQIYDRFGQLHGVFHLAGVIQPDFLPRKSDSAIRSVIDPKAQGASVLDLVTASDPLDFFAAYSSLSAVMGDFGQCDYAVANRLLEEFATRRSHLADLQLRQGRTISIGWPLWKNGGMHLEPEKEERYIAASGLTPIASDEAMAALELCLTSGETALYMALGEEAHLESIFNPPATILPQTQPIAATCPSRAPLSQSLCEMVAARLELPVHRVSADANLSTLGIDSLNMKSLAEAIGTTYKVSLSPSLFFQRNTIAGIAAYLKPLVESSSAAIHETGATTPRNDLVALEPVAVIGMSGRFPQSNNLEEFWSHLVAEHDLITEIPADRWNWREHPEIPRWGGFMPDLDRFDAAFFGISPREAVFMDPQHRIFLETVWHTFEEAGYAPSAFAGRSVGVFVGCQFNEYLGLSGGIEDANAQAALGSTRTMLPNRVSYLLDFRGPSEAIDTACSSALIAVHRAVRSIQSGECEAAIAGGVSAILSHETYTLAHRLGMLSPEGRCKSFDRSANGYVKGEGVGAILLKPLSRAIADGDHIHAVIRSTAENHGGRANFLTAPNPEAQAQLIVDAWLRAGIDPTDISYLEAHGTGTELGDPVEVDALRRAYSQFRIDSPRVSIGSVKSNIGHLEPAAGIAGLLKAVLALKHRVIPATLHVNEINPYLRLDSSQLSLPTKTIAWPESPGTPRLCGVSSFGFGGSNAHVTLQEYLPPPPKPSEERLHYVPISAKTGAQLRVRVTDLVKVLVCFEANWDDFVFTLQSGRETMNHRLVVKASSPAELSSTLTSWLAGDETSSHLWHGVAGQGFVNELFDSQEELESFIRQRIQLGKVSNIVRLWTQGLAIPWTLLHGGVASRRLSLPVYPFDRTRHWFDTPLRHNMASAETPANETPMQAPAAFTAEVAPPATLAGSTCSSEVLLRQQLRELFASALYLTSDSIDDVASFADLGLDSILAVEIVKQINEIYSLDLKATRLYDYSNLKDLSVYVLSRLPVLSAGAVPEVLPAASERSSARHLTRAKQLLGECLSIDADEVPDRTDLLELGLDLVSANTLCAALANEFSIILAPGRILEFTSIEDLADGIAHAEALIPIPPLPEEPTSPGTPLGVAAADKQPTEHMAIAIIGMSGRFPGADNLEEYWNNLRAGIDSVTEVPPGRWTQASETERMFRGGFLKSIDLFDPLFFNISPGEADRIEPQQRLFLEEAWKALEDAGYSASALGKKQCALFVGVAPGDYTQHGAGGANLSPSGNSNSILAARLAYFLDLKGPAISLDTACSSALVATHLACQGLIRGEYQIALAGGISVFTSPTTHVLTSQMQMLSADGKCKAFDNSADGFVPSEGVGVVVLKPLAQAMADRDQIYAVIRGSGINQDGRTNGMLAPSVLSQSHLQREVHRRYGIHTADLSYVEAHGTGTRLGDPIEIEALSDSFRASGARPQSCAVGSVKTNIGHSLPAAGIAGLIKLALAFRHEQIPPSLHCTRENEHIDFAATPFFVNRTLRHWPHSGLVPRLAGINSFGMSGTNAHLVLEEAPRPATLSQDRPTWLFTLSGKTREACQARISDLEKFLSRSSTPIPLSDLSYTLNVCRTHFSWRTAFIASSHAELIEKLQLASPSRPISPEMPADLRQPDHATQVELPQLAARYAEGYDPNFAPLYAEGWYRKISLPAYPFARRHHWLPTTIPQKHPLIDRVESQLEQHVATKHFTLSDRTVADHRVATEYLLPGVALIEMARAAASTIKPGRPMTGMRDIIWRSPLVVPEQGTDFSLRLSVPPSGGLRCELIGESGSVGSAGQLVFDRRPSSEKLDLEAIRSRCLRLVEGVVIYDSLRRMGIDHGPYFQHLESARVGDDEVLATLHCKLSQDEIVAMPMHPAILDAALHSLAALTASKDGPSAPMLPFALESVSFHSPLVCSCFVHARPSVVRSKEKTSFDLTIADADGSVIAKLSGFHARSLPDTLPRESAALSEAKLLAFRPVWKASAPIHPRQADSGNILIFHREGEVALAHALAAEHGFQAKLIVLNKRFDHLANGSLRVDYHSSVDFFRVFEAFPPARIYFLGAVPANLEEGLSLDPDIVDDGQELGVWTLLRLCRALTLLPPGPRTATLVVVTVGVNHVLASDRIQPGAASCTGFALALARETQGLPVITLDLEAGFQPEVAATMLATETVPATEIAIRGVERFELTLDPMTTSLPDSDNASLKQGGVYIIVGGNGGLGREFARYFATQYKARLVLVGRSEAKPGLQSFLKELDQLGATAVYEQADATSLLQMQQVVTKTLERWGRISGVVHSAFDLCDRLLANMDDQAFRTTLASKVRTTSVLVRALSGLALDWITIFSSSVSFVGGAGQSNYTAGSRFQDAFALAARRALSCPVHVINWGFWGHTGSVATEAHRKRAASLGVASITTEEGTALLEQVLLSPEPQIVALKLSNANLLQGMTRETRSSTREVEGSHQATSHSCDLQHYLRSILTTMLRLQPDDVEEGRTFDQYGIDSLVSIDIVRRLEQDYGSLPATLLFDHPDLRQLDRYLQSTYPAESHRLTTSRSLSAVAGQAGSKASLVAIHASGSCPISFWVHSLMGEVSWVVRLAHHLGSDYPVYAFQSDSSDEAPTVSSFQVLAASYVTALRTVQPHGPYVLGGYSLGGAIAFEMAQQLHASGETISALIFIDSYAPQSGATRSFSELSWDGFMVLMLTNTLIAQWGGSTPLRAEVLPPNNTDEQIAVACRHLRSTTNTFQSLETLASTLHRSLQSSLRNAELFESYVASPFPVAVKALLLRNCQGFVSRSNPYSIPAVAIDESEEDHGWNRWLPSPPLIIRMDADHLSLGQEPAIAKVAEEVKQFLRPSNPSDTRTRIFEVVRDQVLRVLDGVEPLSVTLETNLRDIGTNSIDRVEIAIGSMEQLQLDVPRTKLSTVQDLRGLVELFEAHTS